MPSVVVAGGFVDCSHSGRAKLKSGNAKLTVNGASVVTMGMEVGLSFLPPTAPITPDNPIPCPHLGPGSPPPPSPCSATMTATNGVSTKITVGGVGVLLDTATGSAINANDPGATWQVSDSGQTILREA